MSAPTFRPTEDGFADVLVRRSRRRRQRHAAVAAVSTGVAVVAAVAALSATGGGTDSLRVEPAGPVTGGAPPAPGGTVTSAPSPASTPAGGTPGASQQASPAITAGAGGGLPVASTPPSGSPRPAFVISTATTRTTVPYDTARPCADTSGRAASGWCVQVPGPFTARGGHPTALSVALCRLPGLDGRAHFPGTLEADFALGTTGQDRHLVWHYASQHPDRAAAHAISVASATCLLWRTTWSVRDDRGSPVAPGDYELAIAVRADNVAAAGETVVTETYHFTVT